MTQEKYIFCLGDDEYPATREEMNMFSDSIKKLMKSRNSHSALVTGHRLKVYKVQDDMLYEVVDVLRPNGTYLGNTLNSAISKQFNIE